MSSEHTPTPSVPGETLQPTAFPSDLERFMEVSGVGPNGRPKAHVLLRQYLQYSDGSTQDISTYSTDKPVLSFFKRAGFINFYLDFGSNRDMDLRMIWDALEDFGRPENSVSYLDEEIESGEYNTPTGPKMVYFPTLDLAICPIGREDEFMIHCYNPALWALSPNDPQGTNPCVLRMCFWEGSVTVVNDLEKLNLAQIQSELLAEQEAEQRGNSHMQ